MASLYGPHYEAIWREALIRPGHDDLFTSLASETAEYFGLSQEEAEGRLVEAWERRWDVISAHFPQDSSKDSLEAYYSEHEHGIYHSMYWHSLRRDRYALHSAAALRQAEFLDLASDSPERSAYDAVVSLDVLEHVAEPPLSGWGAPPGVSLEPGRISSGRSAACA